MIYLIGATLFVLMFAGLACLVHGVAVAIDMFCCSKEAD